VSHSASARLIVDTRNGEHEHVFKIGAPAPVIVRRERVSMANEKAVA